MAEAMPTNQNDDSLVPEGLHFLDLVRKQEDSCEAETDELVPNLGEKGPACLEQIGTLLSLLDRMASCWWVCQGDDHLIEYLCGRVASNARAALRLMWFGFYDESLLICRSMGETANLLQLFAKDRDILEDWKIASRNDRIKKYGPAKVRICLESIDMRPLITKERYSKLSERSAHVNPNTKPQSYNLFGIPFGGALVQDEGLLICLNEIALPLVSTAISGVRLIKLDKSIRERIISSSFELAELIGGANIIEIEDYHRQVFGNLRSHQVERIANVFRRFLSGPTDSSGA